jgi:TfoX/Sxy family transcriptional regulator of competence genes
VAVSESFLTFVLEQLDGVRGIVTKRMFGGVGIYSGERFFAVIDNDTLFFKVDDDLTVWARDSIAAAGTKTSGQRNKRPRVQRGGAR